MDAPSIATSTVFQPLNDGQIRLLQLHPGSRTAPLRCHLDTVSLASRPYYEALSYAWGDDDPQQQRLHHVTFPGDEKIGVTANLHSALVHLRRAEVGGRPRTLWVDALSIDQTDAVEKGAQVQMMGDIFRAAAKTWIWLGEEAGADNAIVDHLLHHHEDNNTDSDDDAAAAARTLADTSFAALRHFFSRPWFRRLWVLQEALLSRRPFARVGARPPIPFRRVVRLRQALVFGNLGNARGDVFERCYMASCMREWDALRACLLVDDDDDDDDDAVTTEAEEAGEGGGGGGDAAAAGAGAAAAAAGGSGWPLVLAMPMTEQLECSLFADRVFALLGLATARDRARVAADYAKPLARLQAEVCAHMIASSPGAALHTMGGGGGGGGDDDVGERDEEERPSWARDWSRPKKVRWHFIRRREGAGRDMWSILPKQYGQEERKGYAWLDDRAGALPWKMEEGKEKEKEKEEEEDASGGGGDGGGLGVELQLARFSGDLKTLALKGVVTDTVSAVRVRVDADGHHQSTCENWKGFARERATGYASREDLDEAFGNALCRGSYRDDRGNVLTSCAQAYGAWIKGEEDVTEDPTGTGESKKRPVIDYSHRVNRLLPGRAFVVTEKGLLGLAPEKVAEGDVVCFFMGCSDPFVLRPLQGKHTFLFVGETYIPGIMDGEWIAGADGQKVTEFWIE
ncbi:hypothetical protein SLS58_009957 [Diplodia intermedia]|uniref:Heterokaryon incompatibility domain-containing protein n=1 Tax=Diplodia intermedia TaxID=856260 RepID=A0ABR3T9N9_9PEZI